MRDVDVRVDQQVTVKHGRIVPDDDAAGGGSSESSATEVGPPLPDRALVHVALVGDLARVQRGGLAEHEQPLDALRRAAAGGREPLHGLPQVGAQPVVRDAVVVAPRGVVGVQPHHRGDLGARSPRR